MKLISTTEAAKILRLSERRVRALIAEEKLPAQKLGRDYAIDLAALKSFRVHGKAGRPAKERVPKQQSPKIRTKLQ